MIENIMPEGFLLPGTAMKFDLTNAIRGLRGMPRAVLLAGFANTASPELLMGAAVKVTSEKQVIALAGEYSVLHQMYLAMPKIARMGLPVHLLKLDHTIGTKAQRTLEFAFTGTLGADLAVVIRCNGYNIPLTLTAGSDQEDVAAAVNTAINANAVKANTTSTVLTNVVTATCAFGGTESNDMLFCIYGTEKSDVEITVTPGLPTEGTGNQDLSTLFTYMAQQRITSIAWPGRLNSTNYAAVASQLTELWGPELQRDTQLIEIAAEQSSAAITNLMATRNCNQIATLGLSSLLQSPVWAICAAAAGAIEYQASIDPAVPYRDIALTNVLPPINDFDSTERQGLLTDGCSTLISNQNTLYIERMVTNYTQNASSVDDASFRNLEWVKTMSWWRWFVTSEFGLKYRNYKMAEVWDDAFEGQRIMTLMLGEEVILGCYRQAINAGLMQDMSGYQEDLVVEVAGASGRLKYLEKPRLITQHYQTEVTSEPILGSLS